MEFFDANTHLPPRKRLLAELKRDTLRVRLRKRSSGVANSVALATAEVATAARNAATEKAAAAAKAKAAAKSALLFLDSVSRSRNLRKGCLSKHKVRKKQIPIELLYKAHLPAGSQKADEELARKLHLAMNSSPRISNNKRKCIQNFGREVHCNGNGVCIDKSPVLHEDSVRMTNKYFIEKSKEKIEGCSEAEEEQGESDYCTEEQKCGSRVRVITEGRKVKIKKKKLPLSQYGLGDQAEDVDEDYIGIEIQEDQGVAMLF
ncbi:hypothetical protein OPV22_012012 [Ensete ventricosum]|uniref:Histone chaperone domain-containing protein n=1 Tax=Ensete ventricosum TaxID=4639 RepID=A0AAV8R6K6_ENSVE|nr:hypothetical protein OPV22_012012 [Ensete ventricosum]